MICDIYPSIDTRPSRITNTSKHNMPPVRPMSMMYKHSPAPHTSCFSDGISPANTSGAEKLMVVDVTGISPVRRAREDPKSARCRSLRSEATSTLSDFTSWHCGNTAGMLQFLRVVSELSTSLLAVVDDLVTVGAGGMFCSSPVLGSSSRPSSSSSSSLLFFFLLLFLADIAILLLFNPLLILSVSSWFVVVVVVVAVAVVVVAVAVAVAVVVVVAAVVVVVVVVAAAFLVVAVVDFVVAAVRW